MRYATIEATRLPALRSGEPGWILGWRWIGRPWWPALADYWEWRRGFEPGCPWRLVCVHVRPWSLEAVLARADGLLAGVAAAYWLFYHVLHPGYWQAARQLFRAARALGYGYIEEGVMWRWRDLWRRQPSRGGKQ